MQDGLPSPSPFIVFSGIQATGNLHLGNYLGALKNFVTLQENPRYQHCLFSIVDLHALTINPNPKTLLASIRDVAAAYLACGLDCEKSIIFNQSRVYQHAELAWIFNCIARIGWMSRMTQFKDKAGKNREKASLGLFAYPCLMAADILLYKATHVPIGDDQKQHIELTRDIAQKFNNDYAERICELTPSGGTEFFPLVMPILSQSATRVMSLRDGSKKMSKSDLSEASRLNLSDNADMIAQKIRKAKTDSDTLPDHVEALNSRLEAKNLLTIYAAFAEISLAQAVGRFAGKPFSSLKEELTALVVEKMAPIQEKFCQLLNAPDYIDQVLSKGAERAAQLAEPTMKEVRQIVGLL